MKRLQLVTTIVAILLLVACGVTIALWQTASGNLNSTKQNLADTSNTLAQKQSELDTTKKTLVNAQADFTSAVDNLTTAEKSLSSQAQELATTQSNLSSMQDKMASTTAQLNTAVAQASEANSEKAKAEASEKEAQAALLKYKEIVEGLGISVNSTAQASLEDTSVHLVDNPQATNPSLAALETFLKNDNTENHVYIEGEYDCSQFSEHLHNVAEAGGIRCFVVHIEIPFSSGYSFKHAFNAFMTTDYGLVYIDETGGIDTLVRAAVGYRYLSVDISRGIRVEFLQNLHDNTWWDHWWDSTPDAWQLGWYIGTYSDISTISIFM